MFTAILVFALTAASAVSALTVNAPSGVTSGGNVTITWTSTSDDKVFSVELLNPLHPTIAIANNVAPGANTLSLTLPQIPAGDGYTLALVNIADINDVYAASPAFSIAQFVPTETTSSAGAGSATRSAGGSGSATASRTASGSGPAASGASSRLSSAAGSASASAASSSSSAGASNTGAASRTAPALLGAIALVGAALALAL
ncbi:hypothetical protein B0H15DRAFT_577355 [Mycena belliarum]|uniref:Yeast cell wall synthesis Kre9/Knh1-like N-terminal domain-containing protein n=1 Tax=Mycena belliarum TaxID=1033014 RepID=A0AAD6TW34_9AGAR|nr:hypothetical protein B0H15DRAFT_577355 [Mycena belliae]